MGFFDQELDSTFNKMGSYELSSTDLSDEEFSGFKPQQNVTVSDFNLYNEEFKH